jgi:hypothetical protein
LGDDPALRVALDSLGPVAGALVLQPSRTPGCANDAGTVLVAWSRRAAGGSAGPDGAGGQPEAMWVDITAADAAIRCFAPKPF